MSSIVVVAPIMILMALLVIAIPIAMGVYIYRDALRRGMNAPMWTLVGVLAPGFIGLIIYLIVRGDHPDLQCGACGKPVNSAFAVCPYCGAALKENCCTCGKALEAEWIRCAYCGTEIPEEQRGRIAVRSKGGKGIAKLLAVIIAVPLALMILLFGATCFLMSQKNEEVSSAYGLTKECFSDSAEVVEWLEECDRSGEGVYVMRTSFRNGAQLVNNFLIYRNDGYYDMGSRGDNGGWFVDPYIHFDFYSMEDVSETDYTLMLWEIGMITDGEPVLAFYDRESGEKLEFSLTESDSMDGLLTNFSFDSSVTTAMESFCRVMIAEELTQVYGVEATIYANGEVKESQGAMIADEDVPAAGEFFDFSYSESSIEDVPEGADYTVKFSLFDKNGEVIYTTDSIDLRDTMDGYLLVMFNSFNGEIEYNYKGD